MIKKLWRKPSRIILIIAVAALIFLGLRFFGPLKPQKPVPPEVSVFQEETNTISASGKVEAKEMANLTFSTSGLLAWVGVAEGDYVQKWQGIASLDKRDLQKRLERYLNLYLTNRWDFEQTQDNYKETRERYLITEAIQRILDKAQFSLNNAVIDVELADLSLKLSIITSPIEGIVTHIDAPQAGVNVTPLSASFTVVNPSSVYFAASVDEADIAKVKIGQEAKVTLDSYSDEQFQGKVERINFVSSTTVGGGTAFQVLISLPENQDLKFKVGMNGDAEILIK